MPRGDVRRRYVPALLDAIVPGLGHVASGRLARAALFGRKINLSEQPLVFIEFLRRIADGEIGPAEAVKAYHAALAQRGIKPHRPLRADLRTSVARGAYGR